jgi:hypothetical protein
LKKIGFLSFGPWTPSPQSRVRTAADALLQSIDLAGAAPSSQDPRGPTVMRSWNALLVAMLAVAAAPAYAQRTPEPAWLTPGHTCTPITQARADASAGTVNINHDGTPIAGIPAPDISRGFSGIPRSAQPRLTASQLRIVECSYRLAEANGDMQYALFVPSAYDPQTPAPLVVDLHGLNITPLQQILIRLDSFGGSRAQSHRPNRRGRPSRHADSTYGGSEG